MVNSDAQTNSIPITVTDFREIIRFVNKKKLNKNIQVICNDMMELKNIKLIINDTMDIYYMNMDKVISIKEFNYFLINSNFSIIDEDKSAFMALLCLGTNFFVTSRTVNIDLLDSLKLRTDLSENTYYPIDTLNLKSYPFEIKPNNFKILKTETENMLWGLKNKENRAE